MEQLTEQWKMFRNFFTPVEETKPWKELLQLVKFYFNSHEQFRRGCLLLLVLVPVMVCFIGIIFLCVRRAQSRRIVIDPQTAADLQETLEENLETLQQISQVLKRRNPGRVSPPAQVLPSEGSLSNNNGSNDSNQYDEIGTRKT